MDKSTKISIRVNEIFYELDSIAEEGRFIYDSRISLLLDELQSIRKICKHRYLNGECVDCLRKEKE